MEKIGSSGKDNDDHHRCFSEDSRLLAFAAGSVTRDTVMGVMLKGEAAWRIVTAHILNVKNNE